ncbi:MAG: hypothetical protein ACKVJU_03395 [Verrucomicrobiales bacterium]
MKKLPITLVLLALGMAPFALADQFVLFDATFDLTKEEADKTKSHLFVKKGMLNKDTPADWTAPVDYRNGTIHLRLEVLEKPAGDEATTWSVCYIPNKGQKNGYGCTNTPKYAKAGVYEKDVKMTEFWENDSIIWSEGIKMMSLVIKDTSGGKGHAHNRKDAEKFFPTKVRFTLVQVSKGDTYDASLVAELLKKPSVNVVAEEVKKESE